MKFLLKLAITIIVVVVAIGSMFGSAVNGIDAAGHMAWRSMAHLATLDHRRLLHHAHHPALHLERQVSHQP